MTRIVGVVASLVLAAAVAEAHFPFIVPDKDGSTAKVIFSDSLEPDPDINIEKLASTKLFVRDSSGKDTPLEWKKGLGFYSAKTPGAGPRIVFGVTEYGVLQKGDSRPFRLTYCPKALIGAVPAKAAVVGGALKVEIIPEGTSGKTRFQVLHDAKPAAGTEVTVLVPGAAKQAVKTDKDGFTPPFEQSGRYGVFARVTEMKEGEFAGKKYTETRYYATLVVEIGN